MSEVLVRPHGACFTAGLAPRESGLPAASRMMRLLEGHSDATGTTPQEWPAAGGVPYQIEPRRLSASARLIRPLVVFLETESDGWCVFGHPTLLVYGDGPDAPSAERDFLAALEETNDLVQGWRERSAADRRIADEFRLYVRPTA